jgi:GDP/UDP-N,N'-diacetylbacillosamine 2-epimerase (hydrolysing)
LALKNINKLKLLSRAEFEDGIGFKLNEKNILVTFHPVTLENATAKGQFTILLDALDKIPGATLIFTKANSDTDGRIINQLIDEYVAAHNDKAVAFTSLGQLRYISALQFMDVVIGNSSSGLIEAPSFKVATINIGDRQLGRIRAQSVIDCEPTLTAIEDALSQAFSPQFQEILKEVKNPYGVNNVSEEIVAVIKSVSLANLLKKKFYNLTQ